MLDNDDEERNEVLCGEIAIDDTGLGGHGEGTKERTRHRLNREHSIGKYNRFTKKHIYPIT